MGISAAGTRFHCNPLKGCDKQECRGSEIGQMYNYVLSSELSADHKVARRIVIESDQYGVRNDTLYHIFSSRSKGVLKMDKLINQVVVPVNLRRQILSEYHDLLVGGGHQGIDRTYYAIKSKYYWSGMYADVDKYVKHCKECQSIITIANQLSYTHCL